MTIRTLRSTAALAALALASLATPTGAAELEMVFIHTDSPGDVKKLIAQGLDIAAVRTVGPDRLRVEAVLTSAERAALTAKGFDVSSPPTLRTAARALAAAARSAFGFDVFTSYDEPDVGMRDRIYRIAETYPDIAHLEVFGHSIQGRELLALRLGARNGRPRGKKNHWPPNRPEVLFVATHHAREWVAAQVGIRLLEHLATSYGTDERVTGLLDRVDVWLVPIANPDGYEFTFTNERLWRKNLRDIDGDGAIAVGDGVDLNRNFGSNWGRDDEGSSASPANETYRGTAPFSEPENQALRQFMSRHEFEFAISYHTYGNLILYPLGWQVQTPSFDDGIFVALAGVDGNASIFDRLLDQHYDPGVSADLYITNGDFTDWAYSDARIPNYTVELTSGVDAAGNFYGFVFPDDEAQVQTVFEDNLDFALSLAESALDPENPVSPVGLPAQDMYHHALTTSHGRSQPVTVIARHFGPTIRLYYTVDGGRPQQARFRPRRGEFYNDGEGIYYDRYQAEIRGQAEGSVVSYFIVRGHEQLGPYSYTVERVAQDSVLILAAEDNVGSNPATGATEPVYLHYYTDALEALGVDYAVWNLDETLTAPPVDDVLSHYDAVIWYSGDDYAPEAIAGFRGLIDNTVAIREYFNYYNGRLFATGQDLAWLATQLGLIPGTSEVVSDDFFQYYLGAYIDVDTGGMDDANMPFDVVGEPGDPIFDGLAFGLQGGDGAGNQMFASSFLLTSQFLPRFPGVLSASYDRPGSPFDPYSGDFYVYSNQADVAYKRLGGTFAVPAGSPMLTFQTSFDIESDWDFAFVEASVAGSGVWTTLPDANGLTSTATGESCASGWVDQLHPFLANYMDGDCNPVGATGEWHAMTGNSGGWRQVSVDLSAYAGQTVELYITYASDWSTQGLGIFVDDVALTGQPLEDFESGLGDWQPSPPPAGSAVAENNWERIPSSGFAEGPAITTNESVFLGFGFEAIDTATNRTQVMGRVLEHLRSREHDGKNKHKYHDWD